MPRRQAIVFSKNASGNGVSIIPAASITVYLPGTTTKADLFDDAGA